MNVFLKMNMRLILSSLFLIIAFMFVMFVVNPIIDGGNGFGLIELQLSFDKSAGITIVNGWGANGVSNFNKWIISDYIYALSYTLFFISLLSFIIKKKKTTARNKYNKIRYLPVLAGIADWIEDSMELVFINNQLTFLDQLFYIHSIIAVAKFIFIIATIVFLVIIWRTKEIA